MLVAGKEVTDSCNTLIFYRKQKSNPQMSTTYFSIRGGGGPYYYVESEILQINHIGDSELQLKKKFNIWGLRITALEKLIVYTLRIDNKVAK